VSLVHVVNLQHLVLVLLSEDGAYGVRVHPAEYRSRSAAWLAAVVLVQLRVLACLVVRVNTIMSMQ
jgi:hypothetical protein